MKVKCDIVIKRNLVSYLFMVKIRYSLKIGRSGQTKFLMVSVNVMVTDASCEALVLPRISRNLPRPLSGT